MAPTLHDIQSKLNGLSQERVNDLEVGFSHQGSHQILKHLCSARNARLAAVSVAERMGSFYCFGFFFPS